MTKILTTTFVATVLLTTTGLAQAAQSVRIATNSPYRPMEYTTPNGKLKGFDIELGNALCKQAGLECSWTKQTWNGIIPGLIAHRYDAIMSSMTINAKRKKHVLFSDTYLNVPASFFVTKDSTIQKVNKKTLKGKNIGVQRGTVQDNFATTHYGNNASIRRYQNADGIAQDMASGRLDAAFLTQITGQRTLIDPHPGKYRQAGKAKMHSRIGIALRQGEKPLAQKFNKALDALKKNGTYTQIHRKYFGKQPDTD